MKSDACNSIKVTSDASNTGSGALIGHSVALSRIQGLVDGATIDAFELSDLDGATAAQVLEATRATKVRGGL